jgi:prepilin-type N-terminal cleavage/methylation domain-containing protein
MKHRARTCAVSPLAACRARAEAMRRGGDAGFTLIELIVTMSIMLIIMVIMSAFMVGFQQQNENVGSTVNGSRQAQIAGTALVQYLRAAVQIAGSPPINGTCATPTTLNTTPLSTNAGTDNLGVVAYAGNPSTPASPTATPTLTPIYVTYTPGTRPLPYGTGTLTVQFGYAGGTGCTVRIVKTFYVLAPSAPIFTYYAYTSAPYTSPPNTTNVQGTIAAIPTGSVSACLSSIVAIGIDATFFAGPRAVPTRGYAADVATTLNTIVYLHNTVAYGVPATTTTTVVTGTTIASSC